MVFSLFAAQIGSRVLPGKIRRLMSPQSYYCIIVTFLQGLDFRVRFSNNERAGTGGRLSTSTPLWREEQWGQSAMQMRQGLATFQEQWSMTRKTYAEATIPKDISFDEAEATLGAVVSFLETQQIVPFSFPLPE